MITRVANTLVFSLWIDVLCVFFWNQVVHIVVKCVYKLFIAITNFTWRQSGWWNTGCNEKNGKNACSAVKNSRELKEMDFLLHWKRWKHVWNDVLSLDGIFIEWLHYISDLILLCFQNNVSALAVSRRVCGSIQFFYRQLKLISVASQMWKMRFMMFLSTESNCCGFSNIFAQHCVMYHGTLCHCLLLICQCCCEHFAFFL